VHSDSVFAVTDSGGRIYVDPEDHRGQRLLITEGNFSPCSRVLWRMVLGMVEWPLVLDIGVNYGEMLVGAPIPASARLVGFEPNLAIHPFLTRTMAENGIALELRPDAVSDHHGTAQFAADTRWSGTSALVATGIDVADDRYRSLMTTLVTLDEVVAGTTSWCAKIDVEGHEDAVLRGGRESLAGDGPWAMLLEILHMNPFDVVDIARTHPTYLLDRRTHDLIRVPIGPPDMLTRMTGSGWIYPQDALVVSRALDEHLQAGRSR
jgi:FkbM family methyltransferase